MKTLIPSAVDTTTSRSIMAKRNRSFSSKAVNLSAQLLILSATGLFFGFLMADFFTKVG